jgi:hypothetical protein
MGTQAARMIIERIENPEAEFKKLRLPTSLIKR